MSLGSILGKVVAAPVRLVNAPFVVMDVLGNAISGGDGDRVISEAGRVVADALEDATRKTVDR